MAPGLKNAPVSAGDTRDSGSVSGLGRWSGEGHDISLQYSCLEHPRGRGAWWDAVHGVAKSRTWLKRLSTRAYKLETRPWLTWVREHTSTTLNW